VRARTGGCGSGSSLSPAHSDLERLVAEYSALYTRANPPGDPIPILVAPFDLDDEVPKEREIEDTVRRLKLDKAPGPLGIKSEHLKVWLDAAQRSKDPDPVKWNKFVELVQHAFATVGISRGNFVVSFGSYSKRVRRFQRNRSAGGNMEGDIIHF
jgi:hypothetical protein